MVQGLDFKRQKENGIELDSRKIAKHKNDVFRLLTNVIQTKRLKLNDNVKNDVILFIEKVKEDKPDLMNLGIMANFDKMIQLLQIVFLG